MVRGLKLDYDPDMVASVVPNPASLPFILKNEAVNFFFTFKKQLTASTSIGLSYEDSLSN